MCTVFGAVHHLGHSFDFAADDLQNVVVVHHNTDVVASGALVSRELSLKTQTHEYAKEMTLNTPPVSVSTVRWCR
jgi:hypothetical protein